MRKSAKSTVPPHDGGWLVLAAWPPELAHLRARLPHLPPRVRQRLTLASVGVGLVESGIATARLLDQHRPSAVLLIGTAGVYPGQSAELVPGGAAIAGCIRLLPRISSYEHAYLPAIVPTLAKSTPSLVRGLRRAAGLPCVDIACPMGITASVAGASVAAKLSGCALENLEAFAVARAAAKAKIPFAAILGIANHVGPSGQREWQRHAKSAAERACQAVLDGLTKNFTTETRS